MDSPAMASPVMMKGIASDHDTVAVGVRAPADGSVDLDILPDLLGYNVRIAQLALQRSFTRAMSSSDIGSGVAQSLNIDKASIVSLVDRMEQNGWLVRRRSTEDRRRHGLFLTADGSRELKSLKERMRNCEQALDSLFDPQERRQLISLLQRIRP